MPCAAQGKGATEEDSPSTASEGQTTAREQDQAHLTEGPQVTPQRILKGCKGEKLGS